MRIERAGKGARPLGTVVAEVLVSLGLGDPVEARLHAEWKEAAGEEFAAGCRPAALRSGRLSVEPSGEAWRYELTMRCEELKVRLNSYLGGDHVKEIQVMARRARV